MMNDRANVKLKSPPILYKQTQKIVAQVQKIIKVPFLSYWNSPDGSICQNDVVGFFEILRELPPQERIALYVKSDGGSGQASLRIVHLLRQCAKRLSVLVPLNCVSAGTMLALGADEIQMGPMAYLSAVDTSIRHDLSPVDVDNTRVVVSQDELTRVVKLWQKVQRERDGSGNPYQNLYPHVHPLVIGAVDRASSLSIQLCQEILGYHMPDKRQANKIAETLNSNYPSHTYPITLKEARRIGLKTVQMDPKVNDLLIELNELYSEMGQQAVTDFDEENHHNNSILNILERTRVQIYYQSDKDWHYRKEDRRWVSLNDKSSWRKVERQGNKVKSSIFHIR
jgi:hypothetical protein